MQQPKYATKDESLQRKLMDYRKFTYLPKEMQLSLRSPIYIHWTFADDEAMPRIESKHFIIEFLS